MANERFSSTSSQFLHSRNSLPDAACNSIAKRERASGEARERKRSACTVKLFAPHTKLSSIIRHFASKDVPHRFHEWSPSAVLSVT